MYRFKKGNGCNTPLHSMNPPLCRLYFHPSLLDFLTHIVIHTPPSLQFPHAALGSRIQDAAIVASIMQRRMFYTVSRSQKSHSWICDAASHTRCSFGRQGLVSNWFRVRGCNAVAYGRCGGRSLLLGREEKRCLYHHDFFRLPSTTAATGGGDVSILTRRYRRLGCILSCHEGESMHDAPWFSFLETAGFCISDRVSLPLFLICIPAWSHECERCDLCDSRRRSCFVFVDTKHRDAGESPWCLISTYMTRNDSDSEGARSGPL